MLKLKLHTLSVQVNILHIFFVLISFLLHCFYFLDLSPSSFSPTRLFYMRLLTPFVDTPCEQKNLLISVPIFQTPENHTFHSVILCLVQFWKGSIYFTPILLAYSQYVSNNDHLEIYSFSSKHMASILRDRAHFLTKTVFQNIMVHKLHRTLMNFSAAQSNVYVHNRKMLVQLPQVGIRNRILFY